MFRTILAVLFTLFAATSAWAQAVPYALDRANSQVTYEVNFDQDIIRGVIPVERADMRIDFGGTGSSINVVLNAAAATASFPFAEQALKGPKVLATGQHPKMTFAASGFRIGNTQANVQGNVTIRGVTRPITLSAQLFRQQGTAAGDLSKMSVHITGVVNRSAFGATGWSDMVGDQVRIKIVARLNRAG